MKGIFFDPEVRNLFYQIEVTTYETKKTCSVLCREFSTIIAHLTTQTSNERISEYKMSLRFNFLMPRMDHVPENVRSACGEHGQCFHQDIVVR